MACGSVGHGYQMLTVLVDVVVLVRSGGDAHTMRQRGIVFVTVAVAHADVLWANCEWAGGERKQDITLQPLEWRA